MVGRDGVEHLRQGTGSTWAGPAGMAGPDARTGRVRVGASRGYGWSTHLARIEESGPRRLDLLVSGRQAERQPATAIHRWAATARHNLAGNALTRACRPRQASERYREMHRREGTPSMYEDDPHSSYTPKRWRKPDTRTHTLESDIGHTHTLLHSKTGGSGGDQPTHSYCN